MASAYILVVDDEPDIRQLVKEILEDEGYEVETAENGQTARESFRHRRPELVLLDIWMPDIDGISLLKEWSDNDEIKQLRKEVARLRQEREILKKAHSYFAKLQA